MSYVIAFVGGVLFGLGREGLATGSHGRATCWVFIGLGAAFLAIGVLVGRL